MWDFCWVCASLHISLTSHGRIVENLKSLGAQGAAKLLQGNISVLLGAPDIVVTWWKCWTSCGWMDGWIPINLHLPLESWEGGQPKLYNISPLVREARAMAISACLHGHLPLALFWCRASRGGQRGLGMFQGCRGTSTWCGFSAWHKGKWCLPREGQQKDSYTLVDSWYAAF